MNRILFEKSEIEGGTAKCGGARAKHILEVLHGEVGQELKTGEIDGKIGTGRIVAVDAAAGEVEIEVDHREESLATWVDLVLAPPRPRVMKRLLPQLASLGVGTLVLVGAKKVEKDFWGATLLKEENYRPLLVDGLMQSGTSIMPKVECRRNFRKFISEEADAMFPGSNRVVAHPYGAPATDVRARGGRMLLAIGPEGGWTDDEVAFMESHGFARYSLGKRILRTDTATVALLSLLNTENEK